MEAKDLVKAVLPASARRWLRRQPLRLKRLFLRDSFLYRQIHPVDLHWGGKRGQVVDRYFIENFLAEHAEDVHGHVLEFGEDVYTRRFGRDKVDKVDVLNLTPGGPNVTIVANLSRGDQIPSNTFDCIICTQVLLLVYDLRPAIRTLYRILKPGGTLLLTAPGIQKISRGDMEISGEYWRFTSLSMRRLFEEVFPADLMEVKASGNVLAATAFLFGLAVEDVPPGSLDDRDPDFEVLIALRAVKPRSETKGKSSLE
jgi:SAM-dependent methyltransferase